MHFTPLISVALASTLITASAIIPRALTVDELLVVVDGQVQVVNKADYMADKAIKPTANITESVSARDNTTPLTKRDCKSRDIVYNNPVQNFLNWDVAMSSVIKAGTQDASVAVTAGYEISNSLTVSAGMSSMFFEEMLGFSFGIEASQSWTSSYAAAYTFPVPAGYYGAVVSNPSTTRHSGYVMSGCVGDEGSKTTYLSDSYTSKAYGGLSWVDGTIGICIGKEYPLKNCIGDGYIS